MIGRYYTYTRMIYYNALITGEWNLGNVERPSGGEKAGPETPHQGMHNELRMYTSTEVVYSLLSDLVSGDT